MKFKETEIKYLAGLFDADGWIIFVNRGGYLHLEAGIEQAETTDRDGKYIKWLCEMCGTYSTRERREGWARTHTWRIAARKDLEMLLPRLVKHCHTKGRHLNFMLEPYREMKAVPISDEEFLAYQEAARESRDKAGPLKPKNHPTWAWLAGFLDGDGYYMIRKRPKQTEIRVGVHTGKQDLPTLEFLQKALGGVIKDRGNTVEWVRNLGPRDRAFCQNLLRRLLRYNPMKKWKMERILEFHSTRND